jgi:hypothetical protein
LRRRNNKVAEARRHAPKPDKLPDLSGATADEKSIRANSTTPSIADSGSRWQKELADRASSNGECISRMEAIQGGVNEGSES